MEMLHSDLYHFSGGHAPRQGILEQLDDELFSALLVETMDILSPEYFFFVLKSGLRVDDYLT
jgi:hypothetical protein